LGCVGATGRARSRSRVSALHICYGRLSTGLLLFRKIKYTRRRSPGASCASNPPVNSRKMTGFPADDLCNGKCAMCHDDGALGPFLSSFPFLHFSLSLPSSIPGVKIRYDAPSGVKIGGYSRWQIRWSSPSWWGKRSKCPIPYSTPPLKKAHAPMAGLFILEIFCAHAKTLPIVTAVACFLPTQNMGS
jgi:hypothetical protein